MTGKRSTSTEARLRNFYETNRSEELTYSDIQVKFDCSQSSALNAVHRLKVAGLVETVHVIRVKTTGVRCCERLMAKAVNVTCKFAWWLQPYLFCVALMATLMRCEPDWDKVLKVVNRSVRIKFG